MSYKIEGEPTWNYNQNEPYQMRCLEHMDYFSWPFRKTTFFTGPGYSISPTPRGGACSLTIRATSEMTYQGSRGFTGCKTY